MPYLNDDDLPTDRGNAMKCKWCKSDNVFSHIWWKSDHTEEAYNLCETHHEAVGAALQPLANAGFVNLIISEPKEIESSAHLSH
jgi:hypothetical protein